MAAELGQAYVQIMPSAKGISGSIGNIINPEADKAGESAGKRTGGSLVKTIGKVLVAAGIGKLISSAISQGGELEQNLGGTEAVFGSFAKNIQSSAAEAYKNMGLSASDYMATANKMGSLFQGSGMEQQKSLDITSAAMQRAADVASVMGVDTSMAMESIAGAAKSNFTMMDNLGVAMNATTIQAYALEKGINFDWNTASNAEKSEVAMKMFMDRTSQYAGNFARESTDTFTGALGAMRSSWQNVLGQLATGQDVAPALSAFSTSLVTFVNNLLPMVTSVISQLPTVLITVLQTAGPDIIAAGANAIAQLANGLAQSLPTLVPLAIDAILVIAGALIDNLPVIVDSGLAIITGLAEGLINSIPVIMEKIPVIIDSIIKTVVTLLPLIVDAGVQLFTSLVTALPDIITAIVAVLPTIISNIIAAVIKNLPLIIQAGIKLFTALIGALPIIIKTIVNALPQIIDGIVNALIGNIDLIVMAGVDLLTALVRNLPAIIVAVVQAIPPLISAMIGALGRGISEFASIGFDLVKGLWEGIKNAATWLKNKFTGWASGIISSVKSAFGVRSPSTVFAGIGGYLGEGLADGVTGSMGIVEKAMDDLGGITDRAFASDFALSASSSGFGLPSGASTSAAVYNIYLNDMPAADSDKRKLAQYIEAERRKGLMAKGAMA